MKMNLIKPLAFISAMTLLVSASVACSTAPAVSSSSAPAESSSSEAASSSSQASSVASSSVASIPIADTLPDVALPDDAEFAAKVLAMYEGTGEYANLPTATMETTMGTVKLRLFPAEAPKTVENFITHAKNGYYDNVTFHRVIKDFMVQGGDPEGTGMGGESIWGGSFNDEFSDYLYNFRGAISMANAGSNTNGSQFFIVQDANPLADAQRDTMAKTIFQNRMEAIVAFGNDNIQQAPTSGKTQEEIDALIDNYNTQLTSMGTEVNFKKFSEQLAPVLDIYAKTGGTSFLDSKHSVFGYVFEGMDVVDAMTKAEMVAASDGQMTKPKEDIKILKITITE